MITQTERIRRNNIEKRMIRARVLVKLGEITPEEGKSELQALKTTLNDKLKTEL